MTAVCPAGITRFRSIPTQRNFTKRTVGILMLLAGSLATMSFNYAAAEDGLSAASAQPLPELDHLPSFPGAEGYGSVARGGRGGRVIAVTNLNAFGPGSLRAAVEAEGPRIVVFRISGTIDLESGLRIFHPYITIAGQTAPGDGITIKGSLGIRADDVIIRYLRVRADTPGDALGGRGHENIMIDHVSASWSTDEVLSIYTGSNVTIQWSMITEALNPENHGFGGIWGNDYSTYHHNLFAHNVSRNPRFGSGTGNNDFRNNVIYNWRHETVYGGEKQINEDLNFFNGNVV